MNRNIKELSKQLEKYGLNTDEIHRKDIKKLVKFINALNITDKNSLTQDKIQSMLENIKHNIQNNQPKKKQKIGRNEKCICESGLKYKKCCGVL